MSELDPTEPHDGTVRLRAEAPGATRTRSLKRELLAEQQAAWDAGRPATVKDLLDRWPTDPRADPDAASLLVADYLERKDRGEEPSLDDYQERLPEQAHTIANLVRREEVIRTFGGARRPHDRLLRLPEVGDELFGFRLRHPLGRGAYAHVFIAEQPDLASRPVVLKVSADEGTEPQTLARLQHTNIVPIYSVHEDPRAGLRAVCMPYYGGASLACVLKRLFEAAEHPATGADYADALAAVEAPPPETLTGAAGPPEPSPEPAAAAQTPREMLRGLGYVQAVAWTVAQLAEGLHHAHQRGILHRDVKPSNILIDAEGQPLLLDFNVSQDDASDPAQAVLGGTVAYAAPEHLNALLLRTPEALRAVDRRSDVYALGLVLTEMLTGRRPFERTGSYSAQTTQIEVMAIERTKGAPSVRECRPDVPWGLESIARKCLDPDPTRRYQGADQLADDLRRFLEDRPLKYAPELSRVEQARKFVRRHPRLTTWAAVILGATVATAAAGSAFVGLRGHLDRTRDQLGAAKARERKQAHDLGTERALCLVNTTLGDRSNLRRGIAVCEHTLSLYDPPPGAPGGQHPDRARLSADERRRVDEDRRELLLLLAGARVRLAGDDRAALLSALALLDRAEAIPDLPPSRALWLDRTSYLAKLGNKDRADAARRRAEQTPAQGFRDRYQLAISAVRQGGADGYRRAVAELDEALRMNPRHYWSLIQRGICRMELGEDVLAVADFAACTGLWPDHPWGYFNRGYVLDRQGLKAAAIADYSTALERDPGLVAARVNRGLARLEQKQHADALDDFDRALALGQDDAATHAGRGLALEALGRHAEAELAFDAAFARAGAMEPAALARLRWTYGFAVAARKPEAAQKAFDAVLDDDPRHPQALYGRGMLAMAGGQLDRALRWFDRALEADAGFVAARRYRAVVLARRGDWDGAGRDINWCLQREPGSGETLYAAACVAARAAAASPDPRAADQAFELLGRALRAGAGRDAADDPDLAALRPDPRFGALVAARERAPGATAPR